MEEVKNIWTDLLEWTTGLIFFALKIIFMGYNNIFCAQNKQKLQCIIVSSPWTLLGMKLPQCVLTHLHCCGCHFRGNQLVGEQAADTGGEEAWQVQAKQNCWSNLEGEWKGSNYNWAHDWCTIALFN